MDFWKYVSIGNDFVLIHGAGDGEDYSQLAQRVCDRKFGIGGDGLLVFKAPPNASLRMFNPDGTEDFCGNGLRCAALHSKLQGYDRSTISIEHRGISIPIEFSAHDWVDINLPPPSFDPAHVPLTKGVGEIFDSEMVVAGRRLRLCSVNTGSTHTVVFQDLPPEESYFQTASPILEHHEWFPERTSIIWATELDEKKYAIRIWERGVGETLGCGTGSAATAACVFRKSPALMAVEIQNPGGQCIVAKGANGGLIVSAKATRTYQGTMQSSPRLCKT